VGWELEDDCEPWEVVEPTLGPQYELLKKRTAPTPWVPVHEEECPLCGGRGYINVIW
jgi:hypothetical protein